MGEMFDVDAGVRELVEGFRAVAEEERAPQMQAYLKSDLAFMGAKVGVTRSVVQRFLREHEELDAAGVVALAEALWATRIWECRAGAVMALSKRVKLLAPEHIDVIERLLRDSYTWALVDGMAMDVVAPLVERHPELNGTLDRWVEDADFWIRRTALLALLPGLRRGEGDWDRFARYADAMLEEREFFVRKAIGWVLRETGKKRPALVAGWLEPRAARASGVTMREAVKYLDDEQRERLLALRPTGRRGL